MSKELPPSRTAEQFVVRFPDGMRDKIANAAKANNRSMNAEIVARLEQSFNGGDGPDRLSQTVLELESLQRLGSLTYELQRVTFKVDLYRPQLTRAWNDLQDALNSGTPEEQAEAKASYAKLHSEMDLHIGEIAAIEQQISNIHLERKVSGLKELRDVTPVYASVRGKWADTGVVAHKTKKPDAKKTS